MSTQTPSPVAERSETSLESASASQRTELALMFGAFALAAVLLFWRQLTMMAALWFSDGALSIGALVPFVSAYFGWRAWRKSDSIPARPAVSGFLLAVAIALGVIAWNFGARNGVSLALVLIPLFLAGCMASVAGWRYTREFLFPLAFLWFLVPVPPPALGVIDYPLQLLCARFLEAMGHVLRFPIVRNGTMVGTSPDTAVTIAPACNGVRSSITLVMLTIVLARLKNIRLRPAILLVIGAVPLAYAANFMRLSGLLLLMGGIGAPFMPYEHCTDLISGGIWFFLTVLIMYSMAQRLSRRREYEPLP